MTWLSWFSLRSVSDAEIRTEIWKLGTRHLGQPLVGALAELEQTDLSRSRILLLRACVRKMRRP